MSHKPTSAGFNGRRKRGILRSTRGAVCPHCDHLNQASGLAVALGRMWCVSCVHPFALERIETLNGVEYLTVPDYIINEDGSHDPN